MSSVATGSPAGGLAGGDDNAFPKFLSREAGAQMVGIAPPPLPQTTVWAKAWRALAASRHQQIRYAAAFITPVFAASLYVTLRHMPPVPPRPVEAQRPRNELADAVQLVAMLEARLTYAASLGQHLRQAALVTAAQPVADEPDPVGLLVLRNLPEGVTLLEGTSAGPGAWVMAAGGADQLVTTLGNGFDQPVTADLDLVSRAGLPLGSLKVQLHKPAQAVAETGTVKRTAEADNGDADTDAKPVKRKRHVHRSYRNARADRLAVKGTKRDDAANPQRMAAGVKTEPASPPKREAGEPGAAGDAPPSGPLAKFFAWLKSGGKKSANQTGEEPDTTPPGGYGLAPQQ